MVPKHHEAVRNPEWRSKVAKLHPRLSSSLATASTSTPSAACEVGALRLTASRTYSTTGADASTVTEDEFTRTVSSAPLSVKMLA